MSPGADGPRWHRAVEQVRQRVSCGPPLPAGMEVTVNFHPDRLVDGVPLLAHLLAERVYRSQFETGTSNGGLTAHRGGTRWLWEQRMFAGVYDEGPACDRPKYGALNHRRYPAGGSVRFGSSHLRLAPHVIPRVTFCFPDSVFEPTAFGTADAMPLIALADAKERDVLDDYVEAHVHGPLRLDEDVTAIVLDPSFRDTPVGEAADRSPVAIDWHHGFRLHVDELARNADYRGADVVGVGTAIADDDGWLTPYVIGEAETAGAHHPQLVKRVWHCVARFGHAWPVRNPAVDRL